MSDMQAYVAGGARLPASNSFLSGGLSRRLLFAGSGYLDEIIVIINVKSVIMANYLTERID